MTTILEVPAGLGPFTPEERPFRAVVIAIRAQVEYYERLSHEAMIPGEEKIEPEAFCDGLLEGLFGDGAVDPDRFFPWVTRRYRWPGLLHVLAAHHAWRLDRAEEAAGHARRAIAVDQLDLYAQRLAVQATPQGAEQLEAVDRWLKERFCPRPFEALETRANGNAYACCDAWMPASIGRLEATSTETLWNSPAAREIRRSILDGDYRYCSRTFCPQIAGRTLHRRDEVTNPRHRTILAERQTILPYGPSRLLLSHDRSCNLSCPSCRRESVLAGKAEQERLDQLAETVLLPLMTDARIVKVTGSGDPFASHHFRYLLKNLSRTAAPGLKLEIQTNGQLLDARAWDELRLEGRVDSIWISIDAARPATYEQLRRGGSYERLIRNLAFVAGLRRTGRFRHFQLDAVVQAANLDELAEIVALGRKLGADLVSFQRLRNWGTFSVAEFTALDIACPAHPRNADLRAMLAQPCFRGADVKLGNLRALVASEPGDAAPQAEARSTVS
jgi:pyruvate-formate lyase-activating enzyme